MATMPSAVSGAGTGAGLSLLVAPAGATGETIPFRQAYSDSGALVSGTLYCASVPLPSGTVVSNLTFVIGNTAEAGGTHGAYLLLDNTRTVRAVSADQVGATTWSPANVPLTLPMAAPFTTTYTGRYYVCVYVTATTPPSFAGANTILAGVSGLAGILVGTSNTALTTPPTVGTVVNALTAFNGDFYAYAS